MTAAGKLRMQKAPRTECFSLWHILESIKLPYSLRSLRHRNYRLFFFGQLISLTGTWIQFIAQNWLVYRISGSELSLGLVNFVALIPLVPLSLWSGVLSDRMSKRKILMVVMSLMMFQALTLALLTFFEIIQVWHVMVLAFISGGLHAIEMPCRQSFVAELVGKEDLNNAIALNSVLFNTARIVGPSTAGVLIALLGEAPAFLLNMVSFLAVIAALGAMRLEPVTTVKSEHSMAKNMAEGIRYTLHHRLAWIMISLVGVSSLLVMPFQIILPAVVNQFPGRGAEDYGIMMSIVGVGAVIGAVSVASLRPDKDFRKYLALGNLSFPALLLIFAFVRNFYLSSALAFLMGVSSVTQNALANTILQHETPNELRGRVMSLYSLIFMSCFRMGSLQAGAVAEYTTPFIALGIGGAAALVYNISIVVKYLFKEN